MVKCERESGRLSRSARILLVLIGLDLVTKVVAYLLLDASEPVREGALLQLVLVQNPGLGSWARALAEGHSFDSLMHAAVAQLCAGISLLHTALRRKRMSTVLSPWRVIRSALLAWVAGGLLSLLLTSHITGLGAWPRMFVLGLSRSVFFVSLWYLVAAPRWKRPLLGLSAAAVGNFLSSLYPPFEIVDFIYSQPVSKLLNIGVSNLADYYYDAGLLLLVAAVFDAVRSRLRRPKSAARPSPS